MKKLIALALALVLSLGVVSALAELTPVRIAASANPHEILLNFVKDDLAQEGFDALTAAIDAKILEMGC